MKPTIKARVNAAFRCVLAVVLAVTVVPAFIALYAAVLAVAALARVFGPAVDEALDTYASLYRAFRNRAAEVFA